MKRLLLLVSCLIFIVYQCKAQTETYNFTLKDAGTKADENDITKKVIEFPEVSLSGLASVNGITDEFLQSPTANIALQYRLMGNKAFVISPSFNLGSQTTVISKDSINLSSILFPEESRLGFNINLLYDFLPVLASEASPEKISTISNVYETTNKTIYHTLKAYS